MANKPTPKNVIVSGCAQGIGRCIARSAVERGHRVYLLDVQEDELNYTATRHLAQYDQQVGYGVCDLRDTDAIRDTTRRAIEFFGGPGAKIDLLIHNGGIATPQWKDGKTMEDLDTLDEWRAYMETNLTAPFALTQACIPHMKLNEKDKEAQKKNRTPGPCVILIGSFRAHMSDPDQEGYASTKAGMLGLMHSMAISFKRWGIRVNLVAPGRIKAGHENQEADKKGLTWDDLHEDKDVEDHATNRAGLPEDIADACWYLADAGFVTGQDITVDGGAVKTK